MGQSLNLAAVRVAWRVLLRNRSLAVPHFSVKGMFLSASSGLVRSVKATHLTLAMRFADIRDINFARLREIGCAAVVFDKDNCLTAPYSDQLYPGLDVCCCLLSNARRFLPLVLDRSFPSVAAECMPILTASALPALLATLRSTRSAHSHDA